MRLPGNIRPTERLVHVERETSDGLQSGLNFAILVANTELVSICSFNTLHKKYRSTFGLNAYGEWMHLLLSSVKEP